MNPFWLANAIAIVVFAMMISCCSLDGEDRREPGTDLDSELLSFGFICFTPSEFLCHLDHWHVFPRIQSVTWNGPLHP